MISLRFPAGGPTSEQLYNAAVAMNLAAGTPRRQETVAVFLALFDAASVSVRAKVTLRVWVWRMRRALGVEA